VVRSARPAACAAGACAGPQPDAGVDGEDEYGKGERGESGE
jgi:hypothetical protein